jgi:DNA repair protein RecN (Recombination protein N)
VQKSEKDGKVSTAVVELSDAERREEIARMLSGAEITDASRAAADELLKNRSGA